MKKPLLGVILGAAFLLGGCAGKTPKQRSSEDLVSSSYGGAYSADPHATPYPSSNGRQAVGDFGDALMNSGNLTH